jgi:hypothetical protein
MVKEHAGGFLNVVGSCMEERVEGEVGALAEVVGVARPWDGCCGTAANRTRSGLLERIETNADRRWLVESI